MNRIKMNKLGELLIEKGILTLRRLEEALETQRSTGEFLGALLIRKGWVTEGEILGALSEQFGIPLIQLDRQQVDWTVAGQFSPSLLINHTCFPIKQDGRSVTVAISDPLDAWAVSELEKEAKGREVTLVLALHKEIEAVIYRFQQEKLRMVDRILKERKFS